MYIHLLYDTIITPMKTHPNIYNVHVISTFGYKVYLPQECQFAYFKVTFKWKGLFIKTKLRCR